VGPVHRIGKDKQRAAAKFEHFRRSAEIGAPEEIAGWTLRAMDRQMDPGDTVSGQMGTEVEENADAVLRRA